MRLPGSISVWSIVLLWGILLLLEPAIGADNTYSGSTGQSSETPAVAADCSFLNPGLKYGSAPREGALSPEDIPEGMWIVTIRTIADSELEAWFGNSGHTYWVQEPVTCAKLHLMEYDFLTRLALRDLLIPVDFLNWLGRKGVLHVGEMLYHGWHYLRTMDYPDAVSSIHTDYVASTEPASWYLSGNLPPTTTTMVYRALSEVGVGGSRAFGYHSFDSSRLRLEAGMALAEILEKEGIQPY